MEPACIVGLDPGLAYFGWGAIARQPKVSANSALQMLRPTSKSAMSILRHPQYLVPGKPLGLMMWAQNSWRLQGSLLLRVFATAGAIYLVTLVVIHVMVVKKRQSCQNLTSPYFLS